MKRLYSKFISLDFDNKNSYQVMSGVGVPPMTQDKVTVSPRPTMTLFRGSRTTGGSAADGFVIFMYGEVGDVSPGPASFAAVTRKVYSLFVVNFVTLCVVSIIVSVTLVHLQIKKEKHFYNL